MSRFDDVQRLIEELPCEIALPAAWSDFFERQGAVGTNWNDKRRYPRFYFRLPAALDCQATLPTLRRIRPICRVYIKDLSRTGMALLHSEQLFPREELALTLVDGVTHRVEVTRCRRLQDNCYEVGTKFVLPVLDDEPTSELPA